MSNYNPPTISFSRSSLAQTLRFCSSVIGETYDRFSQSYTTRFERLYVGKLGELAFSTYLTDLGIQHDTSGMFTVYAGTTNVDTFDFVIPRTNQTIDIKTAYRPFHRRIMIPCGANGQWDQMPKDFYVGVRLTNIIGNNGQVVTHENARPSAIIQGYVPRQHIAWRGPENFGEGPCMWVFLDSMLAVQDLIRQFDPNWHGRKL